MPFKAPRICSCGARVASGQMCACAVKRAAERKAAHDTTRPTARARGYDGEWEKLRGGYLARNPTCTHPGCTAKATDVDHVQSVRDRPDLRLSWSNLRAYCHAHHSSRTARDQGFAKPKRMTAAQASAAIGWQRP